MNKHGLSPARTILGNSAIHSGTPQRSAPPCKSRQHYLSQQRRWEQDLSEFDAAFSHMMCWSRSRVNIPATLRDWIITWRTHSPRILHARAAQQVADWMSTNRHLFPNLRLK